MTGESVREAVECVKVFSLIDRANVLLDTVLDGVVVATKEFDLVNTNVWVTENVGVLDCVDESETVSDRESETMVSVFIALIDCDSGDENVMVSDRVKLRAVMLLTAVDD